MLIHLPIAEANPDSNVAAEAWRSKNADDFEVRRWSMLQISEASHMLDISGNRFLGPGEVDLPLPETRNGSDFWEPDVVRCRRS